MKNFRAIARTYITQPWPHYLLPAVVISSTILNAGVSAIAQLTPDGTLGAEGSIVTEDVDIRGELADLIEGGAIRDSNLFHSFLEFNVGEGERVYFANPDAIANIFSRVTGADPSDILGTLGVDGAANLFFLNPNGILFGPNARLDVQGSFVGTTASAIEFGDQGVFSATNPEVVSPLLTVDPSAYLFNQVPIGDITLQSNGGVSVPAGQNLTLLGGDVLLDGGQIGVFGVNVFMGGRSEPGRVVIDTAGNFDIPDASGRSDVIFENGGVSIFNGGRFHSHANDFRLRNANLRTASFDNADAGNIAIQANAIEVVDNSSIFSIGLDTATGGLGAITLDTQTLNLENNATISTTTQNAARGGTLTVRAAESVRLANGAQLSTGSFGSGASGDILIDTGRLNLTSSDTALDQIAFVNSLAFAEGNSGSILIRVRDTVELTGPRSAILASDEPEGLASGDLGDITIDTRTLNLRGGAQINGNLFGSGQGGTITIRATEAVRLSNRGATEGVISEPTSSSIGSATFSVGQGGDIIIETGTLAIESNGVSNQEALILSGTSGAGDSGAVVVRARESVALDSGSIFATTTSTGRGGDITIETRRLQLVNNGTISTETNGLGRTETEMDSPIVSGDAGNIFIRATDSTEVSGRSPFVSSSPSSITSGTSLGSIGDGGNIAIVTGRLSVQEGGSITTSSVSSLGNAGDLTIQADDTELTGWRLGSEGLLFRSQLSSTVNSSQRSVRSGTLMLDTQRLTVQDGAVVQVSVFGSRDTPSFGIAGNLVIRAADLIHLDGSIGPVTSSDGQLSSGLFADLQNATGRGGRIVIETGELRLLNGAQISASTFATGNAGDISVRAEQLVIGGFSNDDGQSGITTLVGENAIGQAGDINIRADRVVLRTGGGISTASFGEGNAGTLAIRARDIVLAGGIVASQILQTAIGDGGPIQLRAERLTLRNGGQISTSTLGVGNAGNLTIRANSIRLVGFANDVISGIFTTVEQDAIGNGGDQAIYTNRLVVRDGAAILASTQGNGRAGNLTVRARDIQLSGIGSLSQNPNDQGLSGLFAVVDSRGIGQGGNIRVRTDRLRIQDGAAISATTAGLARAGNIRIDAQDYIWLDGVNQTSGTSSGIFARTRRTAAGRAGNIVLTTGDLRLSYGAVINAQTLNTFRSGDIVIHADTFEAMRGAQVISSTAGRGLAGNITLHIGDRTLLSGRDPNYRDRLAQFGRGFVNNEGAASGLFANTRSNSAGNGGTITLNTPHLTLEDRARVSAQSRGQGTAGDVILNARDRLQLSDSTIITEAAQSSGGDIRINGDNSSQESLVLLRGDSDITTNSAGNGGNITIRGAGIIAFDDSDILARSQDARGGNIALDFFFSENDPFTGNPPFDGNDRVDVNADGSIASGIITSPDTNFIQNNLNDLPESLINTEDLIANSCVVRNADGSSTFVVTGAEGLPERPGETVLSDYPTGEVQGLPDESSAGDGSWQVGDPIIEPEGVYQLPNGELVLSHVCQ